MSSTKNVNVTYDFPPLDTLNPIRTSQGIMVGRRTGDGCVRGYGIWELRHGGSVELGCLAPGVVSDARGLSVLPVV